jgi:hypothetical protein
LIFILVSLASNDGGGAIPQKSSASEIALTNSNEQNCRTPQKNAFGLLAMSWLLLAMRMVTVSHAHGVCFHAHPSSGRRCGVRR